MTTVAISVAGEPSAIERFLSTLQKEHPYIELCKTTQTTRCTDIIVIFCSTLEEDALELFEFQHGRDVQTGFVVREKT